MPTKESARLLRIYSPQGSSLSPLDTMEHGSPEDLEQIDLWVAEYVLAHPQLGQSAAAAWAIEPLLESSADARIANACRAIRQCLARLSPDLARSNVEGTEDYKMLLDCLDVIEDARKQAVKVLETSERQAERVKVDNKRMKSLLWVIRQYVSHFMSTSMVDRDSIRGHPTSLFVSDALELSEDDKVPDIGPSINMLDTRYAMWAWLQDRVELYMDTAIDRICKARRMSYAGTRSLADTKYDPWHRCVINQI